VAIATTTAISSTLIIRGVTIVTIIGVVVGIRDMTMASIQLMDHTTIIAHQREVTVITMDQSHLLDMAEDNNFQGSVSTDPHFLSFHR
jgi:hypothetical protein